MSRAETETTDDPEAATGTKTGKCGEDRLTRGHYPDNISPERLLRTQLQQLAVGKHVGRGPQLSTKTMTNQYQNEEFNKDYLHRIGTERLL